MKSLFLAHQRNILRMKSLFLAHQRHIFENDDISNKRRPVFGASAPYICSSSSSSSSQVDVYVDLISEASHVCLVRPVRPSVNYC